MKVLIAGMVFNAAATAANAAFYADGGRALNLAAAVFCGCMFLWSLVTLATFR